MTTKHPAGPPMTLGNKRAKSVIGAVGVHAA